MAALTKLQKMQKNVPSIFKPTINKNIRGIQTALASADDRIVEQIRNAKEQLFVSLAQLQYLDSLGSNVGVFRPTVFNLSDTLYKQLIPALSYHPKQVITTIKTVLGIFFGENNSRVSVHEIRPNQIEITIPSSVPSLRRELAGSHHFHCYSGDIVSIDDVLKQVIIALDGGGSKVLDEGEVDGGLFGSSNKADIILSSGDVAVPEFSIPTSLLNFDGNGNVFVDEAGNTVTAHGAASQTSTEAKWNKSLEANGTDGAVTITGTNFFPYADGENLSFTAECWVFFDGDNPEGWCEVISSHDGQSELWRSGGFLEVGFWENASTDYRMWLSGGDGVGDQDGTIPIATNTWHHIAIVYNAADDTFKSYVNGQLDISISGAGAGFAQAVKKDWSYINVGAYSGAGTAPTDSFHKGYIDDFRFQLGVAEYTDNFTPPTALVPPTVTKTAIQFSDEVDLSKYSEGERFNLALENYAGSFMPDTRKPYTVTKQRGVLGQTIEAGKVYSTLIMEEASGIPDGAGLLIFNFGKPNREALVKYFGRPNNKTLSIDPAHVFESEHVAGEMVNVIVTPYQKPDKSGEDLSVYIVGVRAARYLAQDIIESIKAAGVVINWTVIEPKISC